MDILDERSEEGTQRVDQKTEKAQKKFTEQQKRRNFGLRGEKNSRKPGKGGEGMGTKVKGWNKEK